MGLAYNLTTGEELFVPDSWGDCTPWTPEKERSLEAGSGDERLTRATTPEPASYASNAPLGPFSGAVFSHNVMAQVRAATRENK